MLIAQAFKPGKTQKIWDEAKAAIQEAEPSAWIKDLEYCARFDLGMPARKNCPINGAKAPFTRKIEVKRTAVKPDACQGSQIQDAAGKRKRKATE